MKKILLFVFSFYAINVLAQSSSMCGNALQFCSTTSISFPANINDTAEIGPNYDCLQSQPNPSWFYFQAATTGDVVINMSQTNNLGNGEDLDFVCWGPFTSATTPCVDSVSLQSSAVDCSYSTAINEVLNVINAQAGDYYLFMVTNYANVPCTIEFEIDSTNTASLACAGCVTNAFANTPVCEGTILNLSATSHFGGGTYTWTGPNGFSSNLQNPILATTSLSDEGYYYVNYTQDTTCNYIDSVFVDINDCSIGITETTLLQNVSVYPNPAKDQLFISVDMNHAHTIRMVLMSITGKLERTMDVHSTNQAVHTFNTSGLAPGIYFLSIETENEIITKKISIEK